MQKKQDWVRLAKAEYISKKNISLKDIAKKYKKGYEWVRQVAARENWNEERNKLWDNAEKSALEDAEGSIKDLITRHSKVARFLQAGALNQLKTMVQHLQTHPEILQSKDIQELASMIRALTAMSGEGLKAERELYPKQMQIDGDLDVRFDEVSDELKKAAHEALVRELIKKPRAGKDNKHS
jgi:Zn-dependent M16 (insulinase) family peptidase